MSTKLLAEPFKSNMVNTPQPAGTVEPVNENPSTVVDEEETVNPASAASPPSAPLRVVPSTLN